MPSLGVSSLDSGCRHTSKRAAAGGPSFPLPHAKTRTTPIMSTRGADHGNEAWGTSRATNDDIIQADEERFKQAMRLALAQSGPYPSDHTPMREVYKWRNRVNKLAREIAERLN